MSRIPGIRLEYNLSITIRSPEPENCLTGGLADVLLKPWKRFVGLAPPIFKAGWGKPQLGMYILALVVIVHTFCAFIFPGTGNASTGGNESGGWFSDVKADKTFSCTNYRFDIYKISIVKSIR